MMYDALANRIDQIHPGLLEEIETDDLPADRIKHYALGNFVEITEEDRRRGWNQYYIWMKLDHTDAKDQDRLAAALAHEYGHFLCRTWLYPKLSFVGKYISHKLHDRKPFQIPKDFTTNLIVLIEELVAWIVAWGILSKLGGLKKSQIQYGFKCWKTYWHRIRRW